LAAFPYSGRNYFLATTPERVPALLGIQTGGIMRDDLGTLGEQVFANIANLQKVWFDRFGKGFHGTWQNPDEAIQEVVTSARDTLVANKGTKKRKDNKELHATVFLRDPISDRLILRYSTNQDLNPGNPDDKHDFYFSSFKMNNYDTTTDRCFYQLHDRLSSAVRAEESSRKARGLTGWVAVTGVPLKINNLKHVEALAGQCCEEDRFKYRCRLFQNSQIPPNMKIGQNGTWQYQLTH
jgi:hypothetical protein